MMKRVQAKLGMIGIAALFCAGCSLNEYGAAQTSVWQGHGGVTQSVVAPGLHFSTREANPSVTLGLFEAQRLYSTCTPPRLRGENSKAVRADLDLHLIYWRAFGIRLTLGPSEQGIAIGVQERLVSRIPPGAPDVIRAVHLSARVPENSRLIFNQQKNCTEVLETSQ